MHLSHAPGAIIGYRKNGRPIRLIAGGSEGAPEGGTGENTPPANQPPAPPAQEGTETDWKAEARKWEKRAKENSSAAEELDKVRKASMSEQEKAVEKARKEGETTATVAAGRKLAEAKFETALARKGLDLGDAADLIDVGKFVDDKGDVDDAAIKKAVDKLAKLAPKAPPSSGGDFGGGNGSVGNQERPKSIREAYARQQT
ncbi:hypothetical protein [Nonomuraea lactucae]|uniref:hypothetical protein n=1 Tax=Nonomuraea lactucae TaxID=2249762 RepID=UPI000DE294CB|nr:hypothetical protein [Nonomuraea lactucae]